MTDEMKLLHALCEALGFDVETKRSYFYAKESLASARIMIEQSQRLIPCDRVLDCEGDGRYVIDAAGCYRSKLVTPILDYKLTKRDEQP